VSARKYLGGLLQKIRCALSPGGSIELFPPSAKKWLGTEVEARWLALSDVLHAAKLTTKAQATFMPLFQRGNQAAMAVASLKDFLFAARDKKIIELGNEVMKHCAGV
jgi:hypothetical protein